MHKPYSAALLVYWQRFRSWWVASVFVTLALALLGTALAISITIALDPEGQHRIAKQQTRVLAILSLGGLAFMIWSYFRDLIVSQSGSLWPGYRKPHAIVFAALSLILFAIVPCTISYLSKTDALGLSAISMALFAANGWRVATRSVVVQAGLFGAMVGLWPMMAASPDSVFFDLWSPIAVSIIVVSVFVSVAACATMLRQTEENPPFRARVEWTGDITRPRQTGDGNWAWREAQGKRRFTWPGSNQKAYLPKTDGLWDGARRWRSLMPGLLVFAFFMTGIQTAASAIPRIMFYRQQAQWRSLCLNNPQLAAMPAPTSPNTAHLWSTLMLLYIAIFPVISVGSSWARQWRYMEIESLRPITRDQFLRQIGVAIGIQMCQMWAIFAAAYLVVVALIEFGPVKLSGLMILLWGSLGGMVFGYGLLLWSLRYRSSATGAAALCGLATVVFMGLVALGFNNFVPVSPYIEVLPILLTAGGVYLVPFAYRRWLLTDLG